MELLKRLCSLLSFKSGRSLKEVYDDYKVTELANLCKMGDIAAMSDMAYHFKDCCTESLRSLLDAYELEPDVEREILLKEYLRKHGHEEKPAQVYMMWLVRAALYGNEEAQRLIDRCPYYKQKAFIPYDMLTGEGDFIQFWDSDSLWKMGLIDMQRGCTDCSLSYEVKDGYFVFSYVADYEPPDEDGFGAEWDYEHIYYDEFFCRIFVNSREDVKRQMQVLESGRENYWMDSAHDAENRKYRKKLCREE